MCKNLITRSGSQKFYFRLAVPLDLQPVIGKKVIKRSLETADKRKAARIVKSLTAQWKDKFEELRRDKTKPVDPTALKYELSADLDKLQAEDAIKRAMPLGPTPPELAQFTSQPGQSRSEISRNAKVYWLDELQSSLVSNNYSIVNRR